MAEKTLVERLEELLGEVDEERRRTDRLHAKLKKLRDWARHLPPEVQQALSGKLGEPEGERKTHFERVVDFLTSEGNRPQSTKAIMAATGIPRGALSQIIYRSHKDAFVSIRSLSKRKFWTLSEAAVQEAAGQLRPTLFGREGDLAELKASDCCYRILKERGGEAMNVLTMAREALRRGYRGGASGTDDDVLMTTAKSFWARLGRDDRFREIRPQVFALTEVADRPPGTPTCEAEDEV